MTCLLWQVSTIRRDGLYDGRVVEIVDGSSEGEEPSPVPPFAVIDELEESVEVTVFGLTDAGIVRSNNEDAFAIVDLDNGALIEAESATRTAACGVEGILLAVSDGMGGAQAGEVASALVLEAMREHLTKSIVTEDPAGVLAAAAAHANARVAEAAMDAEKVGMGATLIAVLIAGGEAITAEVGDSRFYLLRGQTLTLLSRDQTHVQVLLEQGLMTKEAVKTSKAKNVVLQSCGNASELVVAQRVVSLREGDRLLLCSDGLPLHVEDDEIAAVLGTCATLDGACARLLALVKERGGRDNVTIVVADVGGSLAPFDGTETVASTVQVLREFRPGE